VLVFTHPNNESPTHALTRKVTVPLPDAVGPPMTGQMTYLVTAASSKSNPLWLHHGLELQRSKIKRNGAVTKVCTRLYVTKALLAQLRKYTEKY
jgi:hypothetical protein